MSDIVKRLVDFPCKLYTDDGLVWDSAEAAAYIERLEAAAESANSWLSRWAEHVGKCKGGNMCECGLTAIKYETSSAALSR